MVVTSWIFLQNDVIDDDDEDEEDDEYDPAEDTPLEGYTTPLDEDESEVDEYIVFKNVLIGN